MFKAMPIIPIAAVLFIVQIVAAATLWLYNHSTRPPAIPSILTFLFTLSCNCFQDFYPDSMAVLNSDTMIQLSYKEGDMVCNAMVCVDTFRIPVSLSFKCGPLPAGTYPVYELVSPYCTPGIACPDLVRFSKIGSITVTAPASVRQNPINPMVFGERSSTTGGKMYNIRGELIGLKTNKAHPAGCVIVSDKNHSFMVLRESR